MVHEVLDCLEDGLIRASEFYQVVDYTQKRRVLSQVVMLIVIVVMVVIELDQSLLEN